MSGSVGDFSDLLEDMWERASDLNANLGMSTPSADLIQMYGPLTDKITKDKCVREGQDFYDNYLRGENGTSYWGHVGALVNTIVATCNKATPGAEGSITKIASQQTYCIAALDKAIAETKEKEGTRVRNGILAAGDVFITQSLSFIPIAGPIISASLSVATAGIASAALDTSNSSAGVLTLCYLGIKKLNDNSGEILTANAVNANQPFMKMHKSITQNQVAATKMGDLTLSTKTFKIDKILEEGRRSFSNFQNIKGSEEDTLKNFGERTRALFDNAYSMIRSLINASVMESFKDQTDKFDLEQKDDNPELRLALLIIGYYYAKDWHGYVSHFKEEAKKDPGQLKIFQAVAEKYEKSPDLNAAPTNRLTALQNRFSDKNAGPSAEGVFRAAKASLSGKTLRSLGADPTKKFTGQGSPHEYMLGRYVQQGQSYIKNVKKALTSDVETILAKGNSGASMTEAEYVNMWRLYIGSMLIVSHALKSQARQSAYNYINSPDIPSNYVKLIESAGFLKTYRTVFGVVSEKDKYNYAKDGKIRYAAHPSEAEISMLVTFCTIVVYSVDIGRISLGFQSWKIVKEHLIKICKTISATRLSDTNADRLLKDAGIVRRVAPRVVGGP